MFQNLKNAKCERKDSFLRIYLNDSEQKVFEHKLQRVTNSFSDNGLTLNLPELLRLIALNLDDPRLLADLIQLYRNDCQSVFKAS